MRSLNATSHLEKPSMDQVTTIGLDLAKDVFQVHGIDGEGKVPVHKQLRRADVLRFFDELPPCLVISCISSEPRSPKSRSVLWCGNATMMSAVDWRRSGRTVRSRRARSRRLCRTPSFSDLAANSRHGSG